MLSRLLLTLLHFVVTLSFDGDRTQHIRSWPLEAGFVYTLEKASAFSDDNYCLSVLEENGPEPARALALVHANGKEWHGSHFQSTVVGGRDKSYSVIAWRCRPEDAPGTVVVTLDIKKVPLKSTRRTP